MKEYICKYCGGDTSGIDYDYLDGSNNHLGCTLTAFNNDRKERLKTAIKIQNWQKLNNQSFLLRGVSLYLSEFEQPYKDRDDDTLAGFTDFYRGRIIQSDTNEVIGKLELFTLDMEVKIETAFGEVKQRITKKEISNPSEFIELICKLLSSESRIAFMLDALYENLNGKNKGTGYSPGPGIYGSSGSGGLW